jgi:hypothetical protein
MGESTGGPRAVGLQPVGHQVVQAVKAQPHVHGVGTIPELDSGWEASAVATDIGSTRAD